MATNTRLLNFAEQWTAHYLQHRSPVTYTSFDFNSIKRSLVDYLKVYHPEYFNNLIETDELLPLIELFAYVGELYSYRTDMNTTERILSRTTRTSSAIPLANMIGYTTSRRIPATGLVKITSIRTSELLSDALGTNLQNRTIFWNDLTNQHWQSQFNLVLNRVLNNQIGIAAERDKTSINGILVERYATNTLPVTSGVLQYSVDVNGFTLPMEIVSAELKDSVIIEEPPVGDRSLSILWLNDGFGNESNNTGYFLLVKQGELVSYDFTFDGKTPNQTTTLPPQNINNIDVTLSEIDDFGNVVTKWESVPNVAYNNVDHRNVYQIESLEGDGVRLVFGDGSYNNIPKGRFRCWVRTSESIDFSIPVNSTQDRQMSLKYHDDLGNIQQVFIEFSLVSPIVNAVSTESLDKIKSSAPGVFYTQDRMVNGQDHQNFLAQAPTVVKVKAVNRTFAGHSKYKGWYDGSQVYDNVKMFGEDGVLYYNTDRRLTTVGNPSNQLLISDVINNQIEPILDYPDLWLYVSQRIGGSVLNVRKYFSVYEKQTIEAKMRLLTRGAVVSLTWQQPTNSWDIQARGDGVFVGDIEIRLLTTSNGWAITTNISRVILHSPSTKFWDYRISSVIDYDTRHPTQDKLTILKTNATPHRTGILNEDVPFSVVGLYVPYTNLPNQTTIDYSRVEIIGQDTNGDAFPDDITSSKIFGREFVVDNIPHNVNNYQITLPITYVGADVVTGYVNEILSVEDFTTGNPIAFTQAAPLIPSSVISINNTGTVGKIRIKLADYVFFYKNPTIESSEPVFVAGTVDVKLKHAQGIVGYSRFVGRSELYFLWQHFSDQFELVDPAKTNITDVYVVTKQHYSDVVQWLSNPATIAAPIPNPPTYFELQQQYALYLGKGMISNEIVLRPARFKVLFGQRAATDVRAKIQLVVRGTSVSNISIKQDVVSLVQQYFNISNIQFGETLLFSDLARFIASNTKYSIGSVLLVPLFPAFSFGDLYEIRAADDELLIADITAADIEIVDNITSLNIRQ